jgi:hypothetical protein
VTDSISAVRMVFLTESTTAIPRFHHGAITNASALIHTECAAAVWTLGFTKLATGHLDTFTSALGSAEAVIATYEHFVANFGASGVGAVIQFEIIWAFNNMGDTFTGRAPQRPVRLHAASRRGATGVVFYTVRPACRRLPLATRRESSCTAWVCGFALIGRNFTIIAFDSLA